MRLARCRTHKIPWLTTQIILVRAPSKQTLRQPFCAAARPIRTPGVKRRVAAAFHLRAAATQRWAAQKKRSRPGNCARRRRLQKESFARQEPAGSASVLQAASSGGATRRRGLFCAIKERKTYPYTQPRRNFHPLETLVSVCCSKRG